MFGGNLRKLLGQVPNLLTLTSVFFGLLSLIWAPTLPHWAAIAIVFAAICDGLDGRVARLTRTESEFGVQLDSLADVLSFGMAPAFLMYHWALSDLMVWGIDAGLCVAFVYLACGVIRLARFNVMTAHGDTRGFAGIPIPMAAAVLVGIVMASHEHEIATLQRAALVIPVMLLVSLLMVSAIRYPSFKKFNSMRGQIAFGTTVVLALGIMFTLTTVGVMILVVSGVYVIFGMTPAAARFINRSRSR